MARNKYGLLTIIASKEAREKWAINHKDLLELDGRELVIQTSLNQELVLTEEGRLYEKRGDPAVYTNVSNIENTLTALANVVSIHLNNAHTGNEWIIELADGSFYKFDCVTRRWAKYEFNPPMRSAQFSNEFVVEFEERGCDGHSGTLTTIKCSNGQFTRTRRFHKYGWICSQYGSAKPKHTAISTIKMTVVDHSPPINQRNGRGVQLLLSDEGDVYSVTGNGVIQRVMVHRKHGKPPLFWQFVQKIDTNLSINRNDYATLP